MTPTWLTGDTTRPWRDTITFLAPCPGGCGADAVWRGHKTGGTIGATDTTYDGIDHWPEALTRTEAVAWLQKSRERRRCLICSPEIPDYAWPPRVQPPKFTPENRCQAKGHNSTPWCQLIPDHIGDHAAFQPGTDGLIRWGPDTTETINSLIENGVWAITFPRLVERDA